ncbi:MAG: Asp-tRNA(Asn)/Glu-tRNA(Gln) amidotransferase subunit GatC [Bacteroidetes bacterium]|nr:Asp-tRNA(Asn)/Glu-tRNA(Gln) amidotransferase subunit GatC [Bacteroidota bacterium]
MVVNEELVDKLAHLAKLEFTPEQKADMMADFQKILDFVGKLEELDVEGVEPLIHLTSHSASLRPDVPHVTITHEEALKNSPLADSDYFKVPKVLAKH